MLIGLVLGVNIVSQSSLEKIIELVLLNIVENITQGGVHPESVSSAISESVVIDNPESVSECFGVYVGVQSIFGRVEDAKARSVGTSILLLGEVLVELSGSELLVAPRTSRSFLLSICF